MIYVVQIFTLFIDKLEFYYGEVKYAPKEGNSLVLSVNTFVF